MIENLCVINECHACCDGSRIKLNLIEAATLRNLGTALMGIFFFDGKRNTPRGKEGFAYYDMQGACGALESNGLCGIYDTPKKPGSCDSLVPGSEDCLLIRQEHGLGPLKTSRK